MLFQLLSSLSRDVGMFVWWYILHKLRYDNWLHDHLAVLDLSPFWIQPKRRHAKTMTCTDLVVAVLDVSPFWLSPFWSVAVLACRRFGFIAILVVAVLVVAVLDLSPFWLSPFWSVAVLACRQLSYLRSWHSLAKMWSFFSVITFFRQTRTTYSGKCIQRWW